MMKAATPMGRQEDDKSDKNPVVTIRDARPTDQAQLRRAVVEIQEYERKLHNTRLPGEQIADAYLAWADPYHWIALAWRDGTTVGVVTVTTMLYVEWGRLGEIGDLYVLPKARRAVSGLPWSVRPKPSAATSVVLLYLSRSHRKARRGTV